jgi:uncharacterized protein (TIGR02453 family)
VSAYFTPALFKFLKDLKRNNDRDWFKANRPRYLETTRDPALRFIGAFGKPLSKLSEHFEADPRPVGGSLFRIHRDIRFSRDKSPYKTSIGLHFRHSAAKDAHAPGFYLHLEPGDCFAGVGIWHPDGPTLRAIRQRLVDEPQRWKKIKAGRGFQGKLELTGDSLKRPPRGFDPEHELVDDLRRKDFVAIASITDKEVCSPTLMKTFVSLCKAGAPLVELLCDSVEQPY